MSKKKNPALKEAGIEKKEADDQKVKDQHPADGDGGDHSDEEQDKKLILEMIKKHMGDSADGMDDEAHEAAHQAYEAYKEMGEKHEDAMMMAANSMKLAKHMASKQVEAEGEKKESENESESEKHESEKKEDESESHKESETKLVARVAFLERELKKRELVEYLDKKLKETGFGRAETDKIRELVGQAKTESDIDKTIKIFTEAYGANKARSRPSNIFVTSMEKQVETKDGGKAINFGECMRK